MKTLIAIPCGDMVHTDFLRALLGLEIVGETQYTFAQGSLVYDARNKLCGTAVEGNFDRVMWLDSDMVFDGDILKRFHARLDEGREAVSGLYVTRKLPVKPVVYERIWMEDLKPWPMPHVEPIQQIPDDIFEVAGFGFGAVMCTTDLLIRITTQLSLPFSPMAGFGEDLSWCLKAKEVGATLWCDPTIKVNHVGQIQFTPDMLKSK